MIEFDDYSIPNIALNEGSIDANAFQSIPFLNDAKKHHDFKKSQLIESFRLVNKSGCDAFYYSGNRFQFELRQVDHMRDHLK